MKWIVRADCRPPTMSTQPGKQRVEPRRHRQAHQHDQRQQHEDHDRDTRASAARCSAWPPRRSDAGSAGDRGSTRRCRAARSRVGARSRVRCRLTIAYSDEGDAVEHEHPGEEEMPARAPSTATRPGHHHPRRECRARVTCAVGVARHAQHTGGVEFACRRCASRRCGSPFGVVRAPISSTGGVPLYDDLPEVERGMRVEDLQPAHEQHGQRDDVDPVHDAHRQRVAVVQVARAGWLGPPPRVTAGLLSFMASRRSREREAVASRWSRPIQRDTLQCPSMTAPYATLTPDRILDALDSVGMRGDGRLLALNSYENRVYLVDCDEDARRSSPNSTAPAAGATRRSREEHALRRRAASSARFPRSRRWCSTAAPCITSTASASPCIRGAAAARPSSTTATRSTWLGRFIGRIHAVGALAPFAHRPALDIATFGDEPRDFLLGARLRAAATCATAYQHAWSSMALAGVRACFARAGDVAHAAPARRLPRQQRAVDRRRPALRRLRRRAHGPGGAGPVDAAVRRPRGDDAASSADVLAGYEDFATFDPRELHLVEALRTLRLMHYAAWIARRWDDPAFPGGVSVVQHAALLAGPHPRAARAGRRHGRAAARRLPE